MANSVIRKYCKEMYPQIAFMLYLEGLLNNEMEFEKYTTWVLEDKERVLGFFTFDSSDQVPHLFHFCIRRAVRSQRVFYRLAKAFFRKMMDIKAKAFIVSVPCKNVRVVRFIRAYLRSNPYSVQDGQYFFVKGVRTWAEEALQSRKSPV